MTQKNAARLGALALLLAASVPAGAQTVITGTYTGTDGAAVTGDGATTFGQVEGMRGEDALSLNPSGSVTVRNATITAGRGGNATGLPGASMVYGGSGGSAFADDSSATLTVDNSIFKGGDGGNGLGTATTFVGGESGGAAFSTSAVTTIINSGTFQGGNGGDGKDFGGTGETAFADDLTTRVVINGGDFIGGNGGHASGAGGGKAYGGAAISAFGQGQMRIFGGQFEGGQAGTGGLDGVGLYVYVDRVTIYGTHFSVNGQTDFYGHLPYGVGTITGKLDKNSAVSTITYDLFDPAPGFQNSITLAPAPIPEASTVVSFGVLLALGFGGMALKARRQSAIQDKT